MRSARPARYKRLDAAARAARAGGAKAKDPMKFTIEVECSPEEARRFVGLPDVTPLNDKLVAEMGKRLESNLQLMSPDTMVQSWMAVGVQAQDAFLKLMTSAATSALPGSTKKS
jgi:Family of unknown function (DUF6489)